jgi:hypothetical protein
VQERLEEFDVTFRQQPGKSYRRGSNDLKGHCKLKRTFKIVNYNHETFIVKATGVCAIKPFTAVIVAVL